MKGGKKTIHAKGNMKVGLTVIKDKIGSGWGTRVHPWQIHVDVW